MKQIYNDKTILPFKEKLIKTIKMHCPTARISLFGSRAQGLATNASDIDLAIDAGKKIDITTLGAIKDEITTLNIPFFVDIVDIYRVNNVMKKSIMDPNSKTGQIRIICYN